MEKIDWNNPPQELRFVVNQKNNEVEYIRDDINHKGYNTKTNIKRAFASGSRLVNIAIGHVGVDFKLHRYKLIPKEDHIDYSDEEGEMVLRHLIYRKMDKKKLSISS